MTNYFITKKSANKKTGPIPVSTTGRDTCPNSCPFKNNGCYADGFPLKGRWDEVTDGRRGGTLEAMCETIAALPKGQLWRHNQAGDLPGKNGRIRKRDLRAIVKANEGRNGFTFTHYNPATADNGAAIREANAKGFTINLSANNLGHADVLAQLDVGPVAVVLPANFDTQKTVTPAGRKVAQCPATYRETSCAECGLCAKRDRKVIVGFPAHGNAKRKADKIAAI
jgi:hypothetical protein